MKITVKVEDTVPYTTAVFAAECQIDGAHAAEKEFNNVVREVILDLQRQVNYAVDKEMEKRGIVLGADGLRIQ